MRKTLIALTSALALAAGTATMPGTASAHPALLVPALIGVGIGGLGLGAAAASSSHRDTVVVPEGPSYVAPAPTVVQTGPACYWTKGRVHGVWRRVQVCD